jgi:hypothetical protein
VDQAEYGIAERKTIRSHLRRGMNLIKGTAVRHLLVLAVILTCSPVVAPAQAKLTPTQTAIEFYRALREKRYADGFRLSVYRGAVEGLSEADFRDLEGEFARTFAAIPDKIEPRAEKADGDSAVVFLKFGGMDQPQSVTLVRINGQWLVGERDTLKAVQLQGPAFFFNARMAVSQDEVAELMNRIIGSELVYSEHKQGLCASLDELITLEALPADVQNGDVSGYRISVTLSADKKSFFVTAEPSRYGKSGKLSFYGDVNGLRAEDLKGHAASAKSPIYQPR